MEFIDKLDKISMVAGFKSYKTLIFGYMLPATATLVVLAIALSYVPYIPKIVLIPTILSLVAVIYIYPFIEMFKQKKSIHDNLHFFITYAGTIATMDVTRDVLFKRISEKEIFGDISRIFGKIYYFSKKWNLGYAASCRKVADQVPSPIFADFLDRLAVVMDFGQDLQRFFAQEQEEILNDFSTEYKKSIENIEVFKEVFVAMTVSVAFLVGIGLLAPLLMEIPVDNIVLYAVIGIFFLDLIMVVGITNALPKDKLVIRAKNKNPHLRKTRLTFFITLGISIIIFLATLSAMPLIVSFAVASLPMLIPGLMAVNLEKEIIKKDEQFPVFARTLGASIDVGNRGVISALYSTQVHYFGSLDTLSHSLYRRLRVGSDKMLSWKLFAEESGSDLMNNFTPIYIESIYLGGNAQEIGEIVSKNTAKLISLRKLRIQAAGSLRSVLYGALIGIVGTIFISAKISETLVGVFTSLPNVDGSVVDVAGTILPSLVSVNFDTVYVYIAILVFIHSVASAIVMKYIDGGTLYASVIDMVNMLVIGAILSLFVPPLADLILPNISIG